MIGLKRGALHGEGVNVRIREPGFVADYRAALTENAGVVLFKEASVFEMCPFYLIHIRSGNLV
jgi:hypothetical protein